MGHHKGLHTKVGGEYKFTTYKKVNGELVKSRDLTGWISNLITDGGLNRMADYDDWVKYCHVGSGNTVPAVGNTALVSKIASSDAISLHRASTVNGSVPYESYVIYPYLFGEGVAAGNISEVGVGWVADGSALYSRALVVDTLGDPTTITVLSDEYLEVKYKLTHYPDYADTTGTVIFTGNIGGTYDFIMRIMTVQDDVNFWSSGIIHEIANPMRNIQTAYKWFLYYGDIGLISGTPTGQIGTYNAFTYTWDAYVPGTFEAYGTITIPLANGNHASGLRSVTFPGGIKYRQLQFDPPIPKTSDDIVSIRLYQTWGRV